MGDVAAAAAALRTGGVVVLPTDTVYGVGAAVSIPESIESIFRIKRRSRDKALPVLGSSIDSLGRVVGFDDRARILATTFWPGPLTLVLPRARGFTVDLGGRDAASIAVRIPAHELALELLDSAGPLAVTSANISGGPEPSTVDEARAALGEAVSVYLDGGPLRGQASTVLSLLDEDEVVLREGPVSLVEVRRVLQG